MAAYSLDLSRVDKVSRTYDLAALFPELAGPFTAASVALLPPRSAPTGSTVWASVPVASGQANVLYAGPDADSTGAVVVTGNCDPWIEATSGTETQAVRVPGGRITLRGGGPVPVPGPLPQVLSVQGRTGAVVLSATDVGADASGAATAAQAAAIAAAATDATTKANSAQAAAQSYAAGAAAGMALVFGA
jgi:hypothetical protein